MKATEKITSTTPVQDIYVVNIEKLEEGLRYELQFEQGGKAYYKWYYIEYHILLWNSCLYQDEDVDPNLLRDEKTTYLIDRLQEQIDCEKLEL